MKKKNFLTKRVSFTQQKMGSCKGLGEVLTPEQDRMNVSSVRRHYTEFFFDFRNIFIQTYNFRNDSKISNDFFGENRRVRILPLYQGIFIQKIKKILSAVFEGKRNVGLTGMISKISKIMLLLLLLLLLMMMLLFLLLLFCCCCFYIILVKIWS